MFWESAALRTQGLPVAAKTVADCFRYRDTVGTDVAVEALRDCLRKRKATPSDIFEMAKVDRVARVMQPYLEALT